MTGLVCKQPKSHGAILMKIDIHSHIEIADCFDRLAKGQGRASAHQLSAESAAINERMYAGIRSHLRDPRQKIADMEKFGVDRTILSPAPFSFLYNLDKSLAAEIARLQNDRIAAVVQEFPTKFSGLAALPLQDVDASLAELDHAIRDLHLRGVEMGTNVCGRYLGHPDFSPIFEKAQALDVPILIHPHHVAGSERMGDYYFINLIGNPLETTLNAAHLIFSGTLDRFPEIKIVLAHAGGQLPYISGRLDQGFKVRPECQRKIQRPPTDYMKRFYFDTIAHSPEILGFLISTVGTDRVLMGTDYPFDMADSNPLRTIEAVPGLSPEERKKILGMNASALFQISAAPSQEKE
jgi:aminocarboxymuconate-semialdehyde decarboxylase